MNQIDPNYQALLESCKRFTCEPKELFSTLATWVNAPPSISFHRDVFYRKAQEIVQGIGAEAHPSSLARAARKYCDRFNEVRLSIPKIPPSDLKRRVADLRDAHLQFANQFVREIETHKSDTDMVVCIKYPQTLTLFINAIFPNLLELKHLIDTCDQEFMMMAPRLAIEKLLADEALSPPELFQKMRVQIETARKNYRNLNSLDKESLHHKLIGKEAVLSEDALFVFRSIGSLSGQLVRQITNPIIRVTFKELDKAIRLMEYIPKKVIETDKEAAKALILAYLPLAEEDLPEALFDDKYTLALRMLQNRGANEEQMDSLSDLIAKEPKAKPWLELIKLASF